MMRKAGAAIAIMCMALTGCGTPKLVRLYQGEHSDAQLATVHQSNYEIELVNGSVPARAFTYQLLQGTHRFQIKDWGIVEAGLKGGHSYEVGAISYFQDRDGKTYSERQAAVSLLAANNDDWPEVHLTRDGWQWSCVLNTPTNVIWVAHSHKTGGAFSVVEGIETSTGAVASTAVVLSLHGLDGLALRRPSGETIPLDHGDNKPDITCSSSLKVAMLAQMLGRGTAFSNVAARCSSLLQEFRDSGDHRVMYIRDKASGVFIASSKDSVLRTITDR